jgi:hypothetical protein
MHIKALDCDRSSMCMQMINYISNLKLMCACAAHVWRPTIYNYIKTRGDRIKLAGSEFEVRSSVCIHAYMYIRAL